MSAPSFRRVVLELGHGAADPVTLRAVALFARLLDAELHALFIEDEPLAPLAGLSFPREITVLSREWRPLEPEWLEAGLRAAAAMARRHLREVADAAGVRQHFEVRRGDLTVHLHALCVTTDIVVVAPPRRAGGGNAHGFGRLRDAAHCSVAAVLYPPPGGGQAHGPVVAAVTGPADPALTVAGRIATLARVPLIVLTTAATGADMLPLAGFGPLDIALALRQTRESLIVMTRGGDPDQDGAALAIARGVPVLVVEPV